MSYLSNVDHPVNSVINTFSVNNNSEKVEIIIKDFNLIKNNECRNSTDNKGLEFFFNDSNNPIQKIDHRELGRQLFHNIRLDNRYYTKTQRWKGHIVEVTNDGFKAILQDLTNGGTKEFAEFSNEEITEEDLCLIEVGAIFYMSLGYVSNKGTRVKEMEIRFQRLSEQDREEIVNHGLDLASNFIKHFK